MTETLSWQQQIEKFCRKYTSAKVLEVVKETKARLEAEPKLPTAQEMCDNIDPEEEGSGFTTTEI